jgi:hypothetical protein
LDTPKYRRVLLKISGEALAGEKGRGLDFDVIAQVSSVISGVQKPACRLALSSAAEISGGASRTAAGNGTTGRPDGLIATTLNCLALADVLEQQASTTGADGDRDALVSGALYPEPRHPPFGQGSCGHLRMRHRKPVLFHGHGGGPSRRGNQRRRHFIGEEY